MKKVTKFFMAALLAGICSFGYAQEDQSDYRKAPKPNENVVTTMTREVQCKGGWYTNRPLPEIYQKLLEIAQNEYPTLKNVDIRNLKGNDISGNNGYYRTSCTFTIVGDDMLSLLRKNLSQALNKALRNVREGSRMAIDQVTVPYSMDKETLKDQLLDVLLDKGYKVIAKEYLEKLYEEQEAQQSGIYNENTTVKDNNFSAVGYYINVKVTETSLRVQVVNVSTGEYEGNATVNF